MSIVITVVACVATFFIIRISKQMNDARYAWSDLVKSVRLYHRSATDKFNEVETKLKELSDKIEELQKKDNHGN